MTITITGPKGCGKTTLAAHIAAMFGGTVKITSIQITNMAAFKEFKSALHSETKGVA